MTESVLESDQVAQETVESPIPSVPSAKPGDEQPSAAPTEDVSALREEIRLLKESIPDQIERGLQSQKDIRIRKLEERLDEMSESQVVEPEPSQPPVVGATENEVESRMQRFARRILATAGIAANDPRYDEFVGKHQFISENRFYDDLENWIDTTTTKEARQQAAGAASVSQPAGSQAGLSEDAEELAAELERLQYPGPNEPGVTHPDNKARRKEINAKLKTLTPQRPDITELRRG